MTMRYGGSGLGAAEAGSRLLRCFNAHSFRAICNFHKSGWRAVSLQGTVYLQSRAVRILTFVIVLAETTLAILVSNGGGYLDDCSDSGGSDGGGGGDGGGYGRGTW
jgi:hypothetical protein